MTVSRVMWRVIPLIAGAAALVACGTSTRTDATPTAASGQAVVATRAGARGTYLTNAEGRTLYLFMADSDGKSACAGSCATVWVPLTTSGAPTAGSGVTAGQLGTITRSDGSQQVTYRGHPLYTFTSDTAPGDVNGQGIDNFGGLWWMVSPGGSAITGAAPSAPSTGGDGGGYGY